MTFCVFTAYLMVIWKHTGSLYFVVLKGHSRSCSAILPELSKKNYTVKLCESCMVKDGMGRSEKSFLLNPHHLAFLPRIRRKENVINVLSIRMGLHRSIHVACR